MALTDVWIRDDDGRLWRADRILEVHQGDSNLGKLGGVYEWVSAFVDNGYEGGHASIEVRGDPNRAETLIAEISAAAHEPSGRAIVIGVNLAGSIARHVVDGPQYE